MAANSLGLKTGTPVVIPVIGEWQSFPSVTLTGFGAPTISSSMMKRTGSDMELVIRFTAGTVAAIQAAIVLPTGYNINPASYGSVNKHGIGAWMRLDATASTRKRGVFGLLSTGGNTILFNTDDYTTAVSPSAGLSGDVVCSTGQTISLNVTIPILEWAGQATQAYGAGAATTTLAGLVTTGAQTFAGDKTFAGNISAANLTAGRYTPGTTVNGTNVASSSIFPLHYIRVGNIVTVSGRIDLATTAAGNTASVFSFVLPFASNFTSGADLSGTAVRNAVSGTAYTTGIITADITNDRAQIDFNSTSTATTQFNVTFQYEIK